MKKTKYLMCLVLCSMLVVGCTSKSINSQEKTKVNIETNGEIYQKVQPAESDEIIANINVKFVKAKNNNYVAFITNNNTFAIPNIEINVNFYKDGKIVDTTYDGHDAVLPDYTVVSYFDSYESYDDAKYEISIDWGNDYINHSEKVEVEYNINSSKDVLVSVTNNDSNEIREIEIIAVFYDKEGTLLGTSYSQDIYNVASEKTITEKLYLKDYINTEKIDNVKVYLNQAHTFGL